MKVLASAVFSINIARQSSGHATLARFLDSADHQDIPAPLVAIAAAAMALYPPLYEVQRPPERVGVGRMEGAGGGGCEVQTVLIPTSKGKSNK